jgi:hypothetical protein
VPRHRKQDRTRSQYEPQTVRAGTAPASKVVVSYVGERPTVTITGRVERNTATEVSGTLRGLVASGARALTVDLAHCWDGYMLLTVLARTRTVLGERNGTLHMVGVSLPEYLAALTTAPLEEVFLVYDAVRQETIPRQRRTAPQQPAPQPLAGSLG